MPRFEAIFDYEANDENELPLTTGDVIDCPNGTPEEGWLNGTNQRTNREGYFPASYVKAYVASPGQVQVNVSKSGRPAPLERKVTKSNLKLKEQREARKKADIKVSRMTRYGAFANNVAIYNGVMSTICGFTLLVWVVDGLAPWPNAGPNPVATELDLFTGLIVAFVGFGVTVWEWYKGGYRKKHKFPIRCIFYAILAVVCFFSLATIFCGGVWIIVIVFDIVSWQKREEFEAPKPPPSKEKIEYPSKWEAIKAVVGGGNPEGRTGRFFVTALYLGSSVYIGLAWAIEAGEGIADAKAAGQPYFSDWIVLAKFFGGLMNLNFTILFVPVTHRVINWLVQNSVSQTTTAKCLRGVLKFFPFDQAIKFHKVCGITGFICAMGHTTCHLMNFHTTYQLVWDEFGAAVWLTGAGLLVILLMLIPATHSNVKRNQFEIFWYTHNMWPFFVVLCLFHGKNWQGPNYWKFFVGPGGVFVLERLYTHWLRRVPCTLANVTIMENPAVVSLAFKKVGPCAEPFDKNRTQIPGHFDGQYAYINCPTISKYEWHPMTISAAPHEKWVTFHIRVQAEDSWTHRMCKYMQSQMSEVDGSKAFHAFTTEKVQDDGRKTQQEGAIYDKQGNVMFHIDYPHTAPTQHLTQYQDVMICATGIGVTPLAATLKSVVHHIWRVSSGVTYPSHAAYYWVCSYKDIRSFKWFVRTMREVLDGHAYLESNGLMQNRKLEIHVFLTSYARSVKEGSLRESDLYVPDEVGADGSGSTEDILFWGKARLDEKNIERKHSKYTDAQIWRALTRPKGEDGTTESFGPLTIHNGRPNWRAQFEQVSKTSPHRKVGVMFCGNPMVGEDLKKLCSSFTADTRIPQRFLLHKEVF
jgi:predicted ferric reductase